jgi:hypothetical protein
LVSAAAYRHNLVARIGDCAAEVTDVNAKREDRVAVSGVQDLIGKLGVSDDAVSVLGQEQQQFVLERRQGHLLASKPHGEGEAIYRYDLRDGRCGVA